MKKALALVLALVLAFSMSAMAYADEETSDLAINDVSSAISSIVDSTGVKPSTDIFQSISDAAAKTFEAIVNFDLITVTEEIIADTIDGFRTALENLGISTFTGTLKELFNNLKQKIKDLYCGAEAELPVEEEEYVPGTGSSATAGIAAFAAISVASAAAYVCTKKKVA